MKKTILSLFSTTLVLALPLLASAAGGFADTGGDSGGKIGTFFGGILGFINQVLLPVILGIAFLMFVWGVFKFFILGGSDEEAQAKGKSLMIYAVAGFVVILAFYGIVNIVLDGVFGGATNTLDTPVTGITI